MGEEKKFHHPALDIFFGGTNDFFGVDSDVIRLLNGHCKGLLNDHCKGSTFFFFCCFGFFFVFLFLGVGSQFGLVRGLIFFFDFELEGAG